MISLSADSMPVMSYAKTITRLAGYAKLLRGFTPPAAARHSGIAQQAEQDRRYGSSLYLPLLERLGYVPWSSGGPRCPGKVAAEMSHHVARVGLDAVDESGLAPA